MSTGFGASVKRKEDRRFVTGEGRYTDDLTLPNQAYAYFVRSPYAHARLLSTDVSAALDAPGVISVLTGADYAASGLGPLINGWNTVSRDGTPAAMGFRPALAQHVVRFVGEPVAVVIAESRVAAKDASELVEVDYEDLPALTDMAEAQSDTAPELHPEAPANRVFDWETGDEAATAAAFDQAAHRVRLDIGNSRLIPNAMEPRSAIGVYDPGTDELTLHLTTQNPHGARALLSFAVGFGPDHRIRVLSGDVGGGFGSKAPMYPEEVVCLWAARELKRPVKWTAERGESFLTDAHARDHQSSVELALDAQHRILGLRIHTLANLGAYLSTSGTLVPTVMYALIAPGQYDIPAAYVRVQGVYTNTAPVDAYRGAGRPEACYAIERIMEHAARQLGIDPGELRRINFVREFPYTSALGLEYDVGDFVALLDKAREMIDYDSFPARRARSEAAGRLRGIGYSAYIEIAGFGPSRLLGKLGAPGGIWEAAEIRMNATGTVEVITGCHSHGQGHETTYAQLVCEELGVPIENVQIIHGDTHRGAAGNGTAGSRSSVGMSAVLEASRKLVAKASEIAGHLLEVPQHRLVFSGGVFTDTEGNGAISIGEVAAAAYAGHDFPTDTVEPGLHEVAFFDPQNFTYPAGCYICEVEIDPETGVTEIVDFVAADDFGRVANPMIVHGQIHGGIAQGIGQALHEHCVYDPENGQLMTGTYMDYGLPRADDLPMLRIALLETPCPGNPLGMKGCGEAGAIGATPAVINAVLDAIGKEDIDMPATPARVWQAINDR